MAPACMHAGLIPSGLHQQCKHSRSNTFGSAHTVCVRVRRRLLFIHYRQANPYRMSFIITSYSTAKSDKCGSNLPLGHSSRNIGVVIIGNVEEIEKQQHSL